MRGYSFVIKMSSPKIGMTDMPERDLVLFRNISQGHLVVDGLEYGRWEYGLESIDTFIANEMYDDDEVEVFEKPGRVIGSRPIFYDRLLNYRRAIHDDEWRRLAGKEDIEMAVLEIKTRPDGSGAAVSKPTVLEW